GLDAEQFLEQVCLKAELPPTAWREPNTILWTFDGHSIQLPVRDVLNNAPAARSMLPLRKEQMPALVEFCKGNLLAFLAGATPSYFAPGLPDGNVHGLIISLLNADGNETVQGNRLSFKNCLPLQSTLFSMTEAMAQSLRQMRITPQQLQQTGLGLT